jgi:hypothetical protein
VHGKISWEASLSSNQLLSQAPDSVALRIDPEQDYIEIDGVKYSRGFFWTMANPDESAVYRIKRNGDVIDIERIEPARAKLNDPVHKVLKEKRPT